MGQGSTDHSAGGPTFGHISSKSCFCHLYSVPTLRRTPQVKYMALWTRNDLHALTAEDKDNTEGSKTNWGQGATIRFANRKSIGRGVDFTLTHSWSDYYNVLQDDVLDEAERDKLRHACNMLAIIRRDLIIRYIQLASTAVCINSNGFRNRHWHQMRTWARCENGDIQTSLSSQLI